MADRPATEPRTAEQRTATYRMREWLDTFGPNAVIYDGTWRVGKPADLFERALAEAAQGAAPLGFGDPDADPDPMRYHPTDDELAMIVAVSSHLGVHTMPPADDREVVKRLHYALDRLNLRLSEGAAPRAEGLRDEHGEPTGYDDAIVLVHRAFCDPEHEAVGEWDRSMAEALRRNGYSIIDSRAAPRAEGLAEAWGAVESALPQGAHLTAIFEVWDKDTHRIGHRGLIRGREDAAAALNDLARSLSRPSDERVPESEER